MATRDLRIPRKLWEHPNRESTQMYKFMQEINEAEGLSLKTFQDLYTYSIAPTSRPRFWKQLFDFLAFIYTGSVTLVYDATLRIDAIPRWFLGIRLNFAENVLYRRTSASPSSYRGLTGKEDGKIAVTEVREGGTEEQRFTWGELRKDVLALASVMRVKGVGKGDRIAIVAANGYDTLKVFLACTAVGAIFSSSSTDMGKQGILDRLDQIKPKYLFMDDFAVYNGKTIDLVPKMSSIMADLEDKPSLLGLIVIPRFSQRLVDLRQIPKASHLSTFISTSDISTSKQKSTEFDFERLDFNDPLMIVYSSGTTGRSKCIVHSVGGALIVAAKESILHGEVGPESVVLQYTTTGWIMYFLMVANLLSGAQIILYDGSPFVPSPLHFVKLLEQYKVTRLGTSPKWMRELQSRGIAPRDAIDLSALRTVSSTGMVLNDQQFEWFYDVAFPPRVRLANMSGGTDIAGCFGAENPLSPVYVGGTQGPSLGVPIAVYDSFDESGDCAKGRLVLVGRPGELVATGAFPNMPAFFWNDVPSPNKDSRYFNSYFEKYDNVWTQGDEVMIHPVTGGLIFLGRADCTLNPGGIRFGVADIYSVVEGLFEDSIVDSLCVGQKRPGDEDERVLLFVKMKDGMPFTQTLAHKMKAAIGKALSPRHVPKYIFETPDIPMTVNGKKVELPVKHIVCGRQVQPSGTISNPASLEYYYRFAKLDLESDRRSKL